MATMRFARLETPADIAAIHALEASAFGREGEAILVDALRELNREFISLVATEADRIVGHVCFSRVVINGSEGRFSALAPLAVLPSHQRMGIGSLLVDTGLEECRRRKVDAVFVVGDPPYYSRFGFGRASELDVKCEFEVPDEVFRMIQLKAGTVSGGILRYPAPFHALGAS